MRRVLIAVCLLTLVLSKVSLTQSKFQPSEQDVNTIYPAMEALYVDLHQHPELSFHEIMTAEKMAHGLRKLGFEVTTGVGGNGVVGVLKNGSGPTVLIRTELDALPVPERTGLPFASKVTTTDDTGNIVPVMHACGHDLHMASWMGTAKLLSSNKNRWRGTVVMIGQPAEERVAVAIHDSPQYAAGTVSVISGFAAANSDSVDITVFGKGGHGAAPEATVDPIVLAAKIILSLQTIVSREMNPLNPAVVTVGSIHGGTKNNIIPDTVKLQLTVRSYKDEVREHILSAIERICRAEAMAAGAPREPEVKLTESVHSTYNDPALSRRIVAALRLNLGEMSVVQGDPIMASEDFSEFGRAGIPSVIFWVGATEPARLAEAKTKGMSLPSLHSSLFAPYLPATLKTAIRAESTAALAVLDQP
jgi:amidohydrolase